ncbi:MAG: NAD-dependent epimerase/dehydratase family protein [Gemmatimonadales bacterium]|nr:NAD-dependent epimerase/dehydratase family protein [Gemmatimonadales bacterium]MDZ4388995.1 NAD-dependent epimerase/dehydratase family protein [Gemmatimonadales bacterium]
MRILVTGATGFIGRRAVALLRAAGHECVCLDRLPLPGDGPTDGFIRGDIRSLEAVRSSIAECQAVLHLAAAHHDFGISAETYHDVNVTGTEVVLRAMDEVGIGNIAFFSTAAVYGATGGVRTEETPPAPATPYGSTKLAAEGLLSRWAAAETSRAVLIIRPTVVFGPGNHANMFTLIRQIDRGRFAFVGSGTNRKSLAYVGNLVEALLQRWPMPAVPGVRLYNYADLPDLTSRQIAEAVYSGLNRRAPGWQIPMPLARSIAAPFDLLTTLTGRDLGLSSARLAKFAAAETRLAPAAMAAEGYVPRVPLREAIAEMVEWYLKEGAAHPEPPRLPPAHPDK